MDIERAASKRTREMFLPRSPSLAGLAAGMDDVIRMGYGDVGFITPAHIREAAKQAIDAGYTRYDYLPELREAIAEKLLQDNGIEANPDTEIIISCGAKAVCFQIITTFIEPGDEVIMFTPGSYNYSKTRFQGGVPREVSLRETRRFRIDPDEIAEVITPRTKFISLTTPDAPTGAVHLQKDLERVAELAQEHDLLVIADELYERINYGQAPHFSIGSLPGMRERTFTVNGFSKGYAMTGWRVGYTVAPAHLMEALKMVNSLNTIWLNTIAQYAALAAYLGPKEPIDEMVEEYKRRMTILVDGINDIDGMHMLFPDGTYYGWANISSFGLSSEEFAKHLLLSENVLVNPGTSFGTGAEGYVRLSCSEPEEEMLEGLRRIPRAVERLRAEGPVLAP